METKKFENFMNGIRQQLVEQKIDFVLVATNRESDNATDGAVIVNTEHGMIEHADAIYEVACGGDAGCQSFIGRLYQRGIKDLAKNSDVQQPDMYNPNAN